jgi:hypothetical protein
MSYYDSPRFSQTNLKPIIRDSRKDSRESSLGSRTSNDSRSSAEYSRLSTEYGSSKSNTGYVDSYDRKGYRHYRVPDDGKYSLLHPFTHQLTNLPQIAIISHPEEAPMAKSRSSTTIKEDTIPTPLDLSMLHPKNTVRHIVQANMTELSGTSRDGLSVVQRGKLASEHKARGNVA